MPESPSAEPKTELVVAVCTNRPGPLAAGAIAAIAAQTPALAVVASGPAPAAVAGTPGELLHEPREGLSHARNRALAWAASRGAEAIAFVDDDALVDPAWYEALRRQWAAAPPDVGCIGGPIRPLFSRPPPTWLTEAIWHTLTLLDRGSEIRDLDPREEAVYGANISFRVRALTEIGGFDPHLGHAGARVFFGEEDAAERELFRRGWRIRWVPDAAVRHVIGEERMRRRELLRRRHAFGVALGKRRGRRAPTAVAGALRSATGAVAAGVRGEHALAIERALRAAENIGVLRGRALR